MARYFILSGHFESPAEVDPWTGQRRNDSDEENFQDRWKQLSRDCYGANSASRVLNPEGKIRRVVNNYKKLSFSFSPLLLNELREEAPNVYRRILEADQESVSALGHGNALAQPFHNLILPLASGPEIRFQLQWGVEAFQDHFQRVPEGFWLPQQAVNPVVLDALVDLGVRYILLSPWQAEGIMPAGLGSWSSLKDLPAPSNRPFRIDRPGGSLAVFFQHPTLSQGMRKEHTLRDAVKLSDEIASTLETEGGGFQSACLPGEVFGHLEPFADMGLAALWERLAEHKVEVINYGAALELNPPQELVKLKKGDREEGTSASCYHGVSRWQLACGCRKGGQEAWNQEWRPGVRKAMVRLQEALDNVCEDSLATLAGSTLEDLRAALPNLLLKRKKPREWAAERLTSASVESEDLVLEIAYCQFWSRKMLEYPLWHYADPALLEARGGFLAALRAIDLVRSHTSQDLLYLFLQDLQEVQLNGGNASVYLQTVLLKRVHDASFPAALYVLDRALRPRSLYTAAIGPYALVDLTRDRVQVSDEIFRYTGRARLFQQELEREYGFEYVLLEDRHEGVSLFLKPTGDEGPPAAFDLEHLPLGERQEIVQLMSGDLENSLESGTQGLFPLLKKSLIYSRFLNVAPLAVSRSLFGLILNRKLLALPKNMENGFDEEDFRFLVENLELAADFAIGLDEDKLGPHFSVCLIQAFKNSENLRQEAPVAYLDKLLGILRKASFKPDLTVAQTLVFEALENEAGKLLPPLEEGDAEALRSLRNLIRVGELLDIDTTDLKNRVLAPK